MLVNKDAVLELGEEKDLRGENVERMWREGDLKRSKPTGSLVELSISTRKLGACEWRCERRRQVKVGRR